MSTTRFPSGVTNVAQESILGNMGQLDPSKFQTLFDDFSALTLPSVWTAVETQAGATQAMTPGQGGLVLLTNTAVAADTVGLYSTTAIFKLDISKRMFAKAKFQVSDNANVNFAMCFGDVAASVVPNNGIIVQRNNNSYSALVKAAGVVTNVVTVADPGTFVTAVQNTFGLEYSPRNGELTCYANDRKVCSVSGITSFPAQNLYFAFAILNGNAIANTAILDYLLAAQER